VKDSFYFPHDYNASQDPKILNLICEMQYEGYAFFWIIIEKLAEAGGKLKFKDLKGISFSLKIAEAKLFCLIKNFDLFAYDEECFWSRRLNEHLKKRQKVSLLRQKAGRKGGEANAKQNQANAKQMLEQNQAKERKGKERKEKEINTEETRSKDLAQSEYGNQDINKILSHLKEKLQLPKLDESVKVNRQYAQLLLKKAEGNLEGVLGLIDVTAQDEWYKNNITSTKSLYYKAMQIMARKRGKQNESKVFDATGTKTNSS